MDDNKKTARTQECCKRKSVIEFLKSPALWTFVASLAVMAVIAFGYFYPDSAQGNVLQQADMQQGAANGQEAKAFAETTGETSWWTGSLFSGMPTFQIAPTYASNHLFDWIGTVMGLGLPSPSNLLFMMMAGMFILLIAMRMRWYIALIGAIAYGFSSYFIIIIGAGHIWKFVTLAYVPPTIAGLVLAYRGRYLAGGALAALFAMMQIASNHVQMTYYFLFVIAGLVIAYFVIALREKKLRRFWIATATLAVAGGLAVTANLPNLYNTYEYSKETIRGNHSELTKIDANPDNATPGLDRDYITQYSYGRAETFSLLIPNIKGGASAKPEKGQMKMLTLADLDEVKGSKTDPMTAQYLQYMSQYFGEPEGTNGPVYVGALIFALFLVGCVIVKGPVKWALLILTLFSVLLALGRNFMWFTDLMIDYMPMYNKFRTVESILVIAEFTMPLLAAMALQKLVAEPEAYARYKKAIFGGFGVALFFCLLAMVMPSVYGDPITDQDRMYDRMIAQALAQQGVDQQQAAAFSLHNPQIYSAVEQLRLSMVESDGLRSFVIVALGLGFLLLYYRKLINVPVVVSCIGIVILVDLFTVNKRYLDHDSFVPKSLSLGDPVPMTEADRIILQDTAMNYRVLDMPGFNSAAPSYRHKALGGYHAAKLTRYQDLIDRHLSHFADPGQMIDEADINVANMLNARYVIDEQGQVQLNPEALGNAWFVDTLTYVKGADAEMDALGQLNPATSAVADESFRQVLGNASMKSPGDTIFETSYAPNRLSYKSRSAKGGVAVFSEIYFPWGWNVTIDGKEAAAPGRVNYVLRAIPVPAGEHEIVMTFDPESVHTTVTAASVSVILIYLCVVAAIVCYFAGCGKCGVKTDEKQER